MRAVNLEAVAVVSNALDRLDIDYALTGGVVMGFLLDYPDLLYVRPTDDIDAIAAVANLLAYSKLEARLRNAGFRNDRSEGAPACRFVYQGIKVDVMPAQDETGRFSDRWFQYALATASEKTLRGVTVKTISATCFIATKLAAFENRGNNDYFSHDIEDIITLIDGRRSVVEELSGENETLKKYVSEKINQLIQDVRFLDALPGHMGGDEMQQRRLPLLIDRLNAIRALS